MWPQSVRWASGVERACEGNPWSSVVRLPERVLPPGTHQVLCPRHPVDDVDGRQDDVRVVHRRGRRLNTLGRARPLGARRPPSKLSPTACQGFWHCDVRGLERLACGAAGGVLRSWRCACSMRTAPRRLAILRATSSDLRGATGKGARATCRRSRARARARRWGPGEARRVGAREGGARLRGALARSRCADGARTAPSMRSAVGARAQLGTP